MGTTRTYLDKPSLWVVIITAILILAIVTLGVLVKFFFDEFTTRVVLVGLIVFLSIVGISALMFLEVRKRTVQKENKKLAAKNSYYYQNIQPVASKDPNWEYSNRTTMPVS